MSIELAVAGLGSLAGMLSARAQMRRAMRMQEAYLRDLGEQLDREYQSVVDRNRLSLYQQAGIGGDALRALGSNLGAAAAGGGVYNSSAVAGLLGRQASDLQSALMNLALQQRLGEAGILASNRSRLAEAGLGMAQQRIDSARAAQASAAGGLSSFLGSLTQYNLSRMGVPNARSQGVAMNGNQNGVLPGIGLEQFGYGLKPRRSPLIDPLKYRLY